MTRRAVAIIGGGPAGLFAAERLLAGGFDVTIYERMASPARKFLIAGRGGLNITHSEPRSAFVARYGRAADRLSSMIDAFSPDDLRAWCAGLGEETFVGSSGRVFPKSFKATPLLRAWLRRLHEEGARFVYGRTWRGWHSDGALRFATAAGEHVVHADATLLALGGASWPRLGTDGSWQDVLGGVGVSVAPLVPANVGVEIVWSEFIRSRIAGAPLKTVALRVDDVRVRGECIVTEKGLEGGAIYALGEAARQPGARLHIDFKPDLTLEMVEKRLSKAPARASWPKVLEQALGLGAAARALLAEVGYASADFATRARAIKDTSFDIVRTRPIDKAISSAGGVRWDALDDRLMLRAAPGVFVAGEMIDWEAPTGGYLLQACFATAAWAADGVATYLTSRA